MTVSPLAAVASTDRTERSAAAPATAKVEAGQTFQDAMPTGRTGDTAASADVDFHHQSSRSAELQPLQKFESFVLRSFIENMLPSENSSFFGTGTAGNIWRSMLAERIGEEMAAAGGVGIAEMLDKNGRGGAVSVQTADETN